MKACQHETAPQHSLARSSARAANDCQRLAHRRSEGAQQEDRHEERQPAVEADACEDDLRRELARKECDELDRRAVVVGVGRDAEVGEDVVGERVGEVAAVELKELRRVSRADQKSQRVLLSNG
jgi:hypothetical protein